MNSRALSTAVAVVMLTLAGCGDKERKPGQALASVNGAEVTILQLNEEMQRAGVREGQQEVASKQLLESLIDRQLLQGEAAKEKLDRDPKVVQAIERAKALIVAQAYMQKKIGNQPKPTAAEVTDYYQKNPVFFAQRKAIDMRQLVLPTKDITPEARAAIDAAKSLDDAAQWFDAHKIAYTRGQIARTTSDLPPELATKLLGMPKGQLFMVREGERSLLIAVNEVKEAGVSEAVAAPQIEQFLMNKRNKEAADAEMARLRTSAKIEYFNKSGAKEAAPVVPVTAKAASAPSDSAAAGVAGIK